MCLTALACALLAAHLLSAKPVKLTILHTNDIHGHIHSWLGWDGELAGRRIGGFDRLAAVVKSIRHTAPESLLLDAGDAIADTKIAGDSKGKVIIDLMNAVGYDAMTIGNHEPDFGPDILRERIRESKFAVVGANLVERRTGKLLIKPWVIREVNGLRVGILGLAYPNTPLTTTKKNVDGLEFRQAFEAAREYIPRLRREAQFVIVLSHLGLGAEKTLAESVQGIDVIIGGHSHNRMKQPIHAGGALIVQAGAHLSDLGRLDLTIEGGRVTSFDRHLITLDNASQPSDAEVARLMPAGDDTTVAPAGQPIVRAQTLAGEKPQKRDAESPADSLFADIIREETQSDLAFLPGVGYGVAIMPPAITAEALRNLLPHSSKVVVMTLTGEQIRTILEQSIENVLTDDPKRKVGGMIQVSGIEFEYDSGRGEGSRVTAIDFGGRPLDPAARYRVATNSMLAEGGHNYRAFQAGTEQVEKGPQYEMIAVSLGRRGSVAVPAQGRIRTAKRR